ncbi:MAG: sugar ABC transporter permease [Proteobacteria bacterium]|nr:sugar ABC transporter permease [Pseudomonadota bacterium]
MIKSPSKALHAWALVAPLYALLAAIVALPEIVALALSFTDYSIGRDPRWIGELNYVRTLGSASFWAAALRTLIFVGIAVVLEAAIGLLLACLLIRRIPMRGLAIACLIAPIAMSHAVTATIWAYLLDFNVGPVNYVTNLMGLGRIPWLTEAGTALIVVALIEFWAGMPHVLVMLYPVRAAFPREIYEAGEIDGATPFQRFRYLTWPMIRPAFLIAVVFRIIITFRAFGVVWILTKGGPVDASEILSVHLYKIGFVYWEFGRAASIAWLMLLLTAVVSSWAMVRLYRESFAPKAAA